MVTVIIYIFQLALDLDFPKMFKSLDNHNLLQSSGKCRAIAPQTRTFDFSFLSYKQKCRYHAHVNSILPYEIHMKVSHYNRLYSASIDPTIFLCGGHNWRVKVAMRI